MNQFDDLYLKYQSTQQLHTHLRPPINIQVDNDFIIAIDNEQIIQVELSNYSHQDFIMDLNLEQYSNQIHQYGLKVELKEYEFFNCNKDDNLFEKFKLIYSTIPIRRVSEKLNAARTIYNHIGLNKLNRKMILRIYKQIYQNNNIKSWDQFRYKINRMQIDFQIYQFTENQHFPKKWRNSLKCKVCAKSNKIHKSKYYCSGCSKLTGRHWSLCLDPCFSLFHQNPAKYLIRKL